MNLPATTMDYDGYPTEEFLEWIRSYDTVKNDSLEYVRFILDNWHHGNYGWRIQRKYREERKVFISTCGWSGNEDMIAAMRGNQLFWMVHYFAHQTGGHYTFRFRD